MTTHFHMDAMKKQQMKFILLARANDGAMISEMIANGSTPPNHGPNGQGPLHVAACLGHDHAIDALLPVCNPLTPDDRGQTPLLLAATYGRIDSAMKLFRAAPAQATPALSAQLEKMRLEFIHKGQIDTQLLLPLCSAVKQALESSKHLSQFSALARHSQQTRQTAGRLAAEPGPSLKSLPIHEAAKRFDLDALSRHLNLDSARAVDEKGRTPLHWAARAGFDLGVSSLLPFLRIDDVRLPDLDGQSASDLARANHRPHLASMIDLFAKSLALAQHQQSTFLEVQKALAQSSALAEASAEAQYMKLKMEEHRHQAMAHMAESEMALKAKLSSKLNSIKESFIEKDPAEIEAQRAWNLDEKKYINRARAPGLNKF